MKFIGHITDRRQCGSSERRAIAVVIRRIRRHKGKPAAHCYRNHVLADGAPWKTWFIGPPPDLDVIRRCGGYREYAQTMGGPII